MPIDRQRHAPEEYDDERHRATEVLVFASLAKHFGGSSPAGFWVMARIWGGTFLVALAATGAIQRDHMDLDLRLLGTMAVAVASTLWGAVLGVQQATDKISDALREAADRPMVGSYALLGIEQEVLSTVFIHAAIGGVLVSPAAFLIVWRFA